MRIIVGIANACNYLSVTLSQNVKGNIWDKGSHNMVERTRIPDGGHRFHLLPNLLKSFKIVRSALQ